MNGREAATTTRTAITIINIIPTLTVDGTFFSALFPISIHTKAYTLTDKHV